MFPGIFSVQIDRRGLTELALFDVTTGTFVRRLPGFRQTLVPNNGDARPSPGTAAARLILSGPGPGGQLYDLPSIQAEPRLLMPSPKSPRG